MGENSHEVLFSFRLSVWVSISFHRESKSIEELLFPYHISLPDDPKMQCLALFSLLDINWYALIYSPVSLGVVFNISSSPVDILVLLMSLELTLSNLYVLLSSKYFMSRESFSLNPVTGSIEKLFVLHIPAALDNSIWLGENICTMSPSL